MPRLTDALFKLSKTRKRIIFMDSVRVFGIPITLTDIHTPSFIKLYPLPTKILPLILPLEAHYKQVDRLEPEKHIDTLFQNPKDDRIHNWSHIISDENYYNWSLLELFPPKEDSKKLANRLQTAHMAGNHAIYLYVLAMLLLLEFKANVWKEHPAFGVLIGEMTDVVLVSREAS